MADQPDIQEPVSDNGSVSKIETGVSSVSAGSADEVLDESPERDRELRQCLKRVLERMGVEKDDNGEDGSEVYRLGLVVEAKMAEWEEVRRREKRETEESVESLMEENRDLGRLLRAALAEKEAAERSVKSGEQSRGVIMQIAERVGFGFGFGFMTGSAGMEVQAHEPGSSNSSLGSDGTEMEEEDEEVTSLTSTIEKIMKNLRLQNTELKRSLEESRSAGEHLQSLVDKQAEKITESALYIKNLEERETMLTHNVAELMKEVKEAAEDVARWREACELEVEAGKAAIEEREKEVSILKKELERVKAFLDETNNKLKMKEKLATAAMAAHEAAEASLRLADMRSAGFRERIEELTRQVDEEAEHGKKERTSIRKRVRHMCWPWQALKTIPSSNAASLVRNRRMKSLSEMEALLRFRI